MKALASPRSQEDLALDRIVATIRGELDGATRKFGPIASLHEGYAVLQEEVDEFWDAVKTKGTPPEHIEHELVQVAAMAIRTIMDCTTLGPSRKDASGQIDERGRALAPGGDRDDGRTRPSPSRPSPMRDEAIRGAGLRTASSLVKKDVKPIPKTGAKKKAVRK